MANRNFKQFHVIYKSHSPLHNLLFAVSKVLIRVPKLFHNIHLAEYVFTTFGNNSYYRCKP